MTAFILNLNIDNTINLSCQSLAILALVKYCGLTANKHFKCNCLYSSKSIDQNDQIITNTLSNKYSDFKFMLQNNLESIKSNDEQNVIILRDLESLSIKEDFYLSDTTLPSLIRKVNDDGLDMVVTGLASVYRGVIKETDKLESNKKFSKLLGFRNNCLKACSEVSEWTYLCEKMTINVYMNLVTYQLKSKDPLRKQFLSKIEDKLRKPLNLANLNRKLIKERQEILQARKISNSLRYLEDHFVTIADLLVYFFISLMLEQYKCVKYELENFYPNICLWYANVGSDLRIKTSFSKQENLEFKANEIQKINNRLDELSIDDCYETKEPVEANIEILEDQINEMNCSTQFSLSMEKDNITYDDISIDWQSVNAFVNPLAGNLPDKRIARKCQQLENFVYYFKQEIYNEEKDFVIVDFCSGGGHLGILFAYMFPNCLVKLVENKEESLEFAITRISSLKLKNCFIYKGNLTNFVGKFHLGLGLHACGSMTDLLIDKCVKSRANILIAPCCYGSIKENDSIKYPRSKCFVEAFNHLISTNSIDEKANKQELVNFDSKNASDFYYKITQFADRTEKNIIYEKSAYKCMSIIDTDRLKYLTENGYQMIKLRKMKPEDCTTKNNILLARIDV